MQKITDPKKGTSEDTNIAPGDYRIKRIGPPGGVGQDWLVLVSDPTIGASENAIRRDPTVTVVDEPEEPEDKEQTPA
ncbi:MAG: hypothetical protein ABII24_03015 [bacterium]